MKLAAHILIIDDIPLNLEVLGSSLAGDYDIQFATSGQQGLVLVCEQAPDLILLDLMMPGMDGYQLQQALQADAATRDIPVIFVTAQNDSASRRYGGSGLGLVISQQLVHLMGGGPIEVQSTPCQGSRFAFTLALPEVQGEADLTAQTRQPMSPVSLQGLSVLVVDDNPTNIEIAASMLDASGAEVSIATSGLGALDLLQEHGPIYDLVLMDVQMPGMDGLEATRRIRANPEWNALPVVAMTANAREEDRRACAQAGMVGFIPKPIERDELLQLVLRHRRVA